jgi:putative NADH-flavin reductase
MKIALIGATGAIGKEIVRASLSYPNVELTIVVRNPLPEWSTLN